MVVNAPDVPVQAEVIFVVEATAANGAYINELKTNYVIPTLEYFHGGSLDDGGGVGSVYGVVSYKAADCHPAQPVDTFGPFSTPQDVLDAMDSIQYIAGHSESRACVIEALVTAQACIDELGRTDIPRHVILLCCSPPYLAYAGGLMQAGCVTMEAAARALGERGAQVSVAAARRTPALLALYETAGGDLHAAQQRNYAKDPRHLVLLRGFSLKERPPSPAPPPVPDIPADVYSQGTRGQVAVVAPMVVAAAGGPPAAAAARAPLPPRARWLAPQLPRPPLYATTSALLTQLAQPSYPPPPPQVQAGMSRMGGPSMMGAAASRTFIWSGALEWMEKGKGPGEQKVTKILPCQVSASTKDIEPDLKVDTWPNKLPMQLMPKQLVSTVGGQYLKDSKSVLFHLQPNEALDALTKVMINGYAGCVHFSPVTSPAQCEIKVLILLYTPDKKAFLGFIPNNQVTFVDRLRKVIQQQKITQNKTGNVPPNMPPNSMPGGSGSSGMQQSSMQQLGMQQPGMQQPGMQQPGMQQPGMQQSGMQQSNMQPSGMQGSGMQPSGMQGAGMQAGSMGGSMPTQMNVQPNMVQQSMQQQSMQQHSQQGMMMQNQMGGQVNVGGKGPRQLDGLEAARQQNLEKIQHLHQTLEAAQQQEAQFMDIMSHLQAAQQQEQHYKQLEEQRKHQQLQAQLQQQLRGAPQRIMRPIMSSNPGLKHLLQQQPQYRPGAGGPRPQSQAQQFEDVNNYEFLQ